MNKYYKKVSYDKKFEMYDFEFFGMNDIEEIFDIRGNIELGSLLV